MKQEDAGKMLRELRNGKEVTCPECQVEKKHPLIQRQVLILNARIVTLKSIWNL